MMLTRAILTSFLAISTIAVQAEPYFNPECKVYRSPWSGLCATDIEEATRMMSVDARLAKPENFEKRWEIIRDMAKHLEHNMQVWDAQRMINEF